MPIPPFGSPPGTKGDKGDTGATGSTGATGAAGEGVPTGGTTNQALTKASGTDYDTQWSDAVPTTRTVNGHALSADVTVTASDVSAVPTTRTVNGHALSANVTIAESDISGLTSDLAAKAPLASPALTGTPTAPTASALTDSTQVATTAYVDAAVTAGGGGGGGGTVDSVVAGTGISVDSTDPANPVVSATGGGGSGPQAVTPIQDVAGPNANTSSNSLTLPNTPTSGNVLILCSSFQGNVAITSVTQTNVTWTRLATTSGFNPTVEMWVGVVGASAGKTVTVAYGSSAYTSFWVGEFTGITGTIDQSAISGSSGQTWITGQITPTGEYLTIGAMGTDYGAIGFSAVAFGAGVLATVPSMQGLSGSTSTLGSVCVVVYSSGDISRAIFQSDTGNHASILASIT